MSYRGDLNCMSFAHLRVIEVLVWQWSSNGGGVVCSHFHRSISLMSFYKNFEKSSSPQK